MTKILVVDNDRELRDHMEWIANRIKGMQVYKSDSAKSAIQLINENIFALVVTDLNMETEKAGFEVLKAAKEKELDTQVIIITAYGAPEVSVEAMRQGAFDFVERNTPHIDETALLTEKMLAAIKYRNTKGENA